LNDCENKVRLIMPVDIMYLSGKVGEDRSRTLWDNWFPSGPL